MSLKHGGLPQKPTFTLIFEVMKVSDIASYLGSWAPPVYQETYDNSGLIVGHDKDVEGVLVALDCVESVVDEAIEKGCNLVVAHHPIIFSGLKSLTGRNYVERTVMKAIKNDIAIYAIHTNLDNVSPGVNHKISSLLELERTSILRPKSELLSKLYVFVPESHVDQVVEAAFEAGAGHIGNYDKCSFRSKGTGTFRAGEGTDPYIGNQGELHLEPEQKLEVVFPSYLMNGVVSAVKETHPYEEVALDVVALRNNHEQIGSGMVGDLPAEMELKSFLEKVKKIFGAGIVRYTSLVRDKVTRVAVCGGSGSFLIPDAIASGADVYITSDIKYHEFFDAEDKIVVADIGHFESEQFTADLIVDELKKKFTTFAVLKASTNTNPVNYL